ncbi:MAG: UDP-N-acetylglucosamine 2-epimerase (non-hydrolyzing) [Vicinamibacteria bacterium]|nr:UDP-N-acetylglucosamine 2-epimerase (non-hydrolyzing) [Vicinamibacteria bacterium]
MKKRPSGTVLSVVAGARPNFVKVAPLLRAFDARWPRRVQFINTGQHYDDAMSVAFFRDLGIRRPDVNLGVGSGSHAEQTARLLVGLEETLAKTRPRRVVVVGDVNSTMAAALVAAKLQIPVDHVEAGLRSLDRDMPEEINRLVTDSISDRLFASEPSGVEHLRLEGHDRRKIHLVGNVMIDSLVHALPRALPRRAFARFGVEAKGYGVVTLHRPSNVDSPAGLRRVLVELKRIARRTPLLFPVHPRTASRIEALGISPSPDLRMIAPLGYLDFLSVLREARFVITDSGGVQEETTFLGVPCLTLRTTTERPVTVTEGSNTLVGDDPRVLYPLVLKLGGARRRSRPRPRFWDGRAAERVADILAGLIQPTTSRKARVIG